MIVVVIDIVVCIVLFRPIWRRTNPIDATGGFHPAVQGLQVRGRRSSGYVGE
jgi:hypothetical protein